MKRSTLVSIITLILCGSFSFAGKAEQVLNCGDTLILSKDSLFITIKGNGEFVKELRVPQDEKGKKKFVAALFAFPFPLGFMGAHRVMLGTKPWVPVVYVATFGGCFGILPLIDFCVITFSKDLTPYENNPNIFMWMK